MDSRENKGHERAWLLQKLDLAFELKSSILEAMRDRNNLLPGIYLFVQPNFGQWIPEKIRDMSARDNYRNWIYPLNYIGMRREIAPIFSQEYISLRTERDPSAFATR